MPITQIQQRLYEPKPPDVDDLRSRLEDQWFDRKSMRTEAKDIAKDLVGFANADGGRIVVGISKGAVEGIDRYPKRVNDIVQAAISCCEPPVRCAESRPACVSETGAADHLLILDIESSERIHRTSKGECYLRVGDETRSLKGEAERELAYEKHESIFDSTIAGDVSRDDLDTEAIEAYAAKVDTTNVAGLLRGRGLYREGPNRSGATQAGWLLFGREPPIWSYVRYIRYAGTTVETGARSNAAEDIRMAGTIPSLIEQAKTLLDDKLRLSRLTPQGKFDRVLVLPEFAWLEAVVNALTHRSYSLQGDGIRIRDFTDRLEVESPGRLPSLVRVSNIRDTRFSRNPHIARVLAEMTAYVRETNEGVGRMFDEMQRAGLPDPEFAAGEASVRVTLHKSPIEDRRAAQLGETPALLVVRRLTHLLGRERAALLLDALRAGRTPSSREVAGALGVAVPTARQYLRLLWSAGLVESTANSSTDPTARWRATASALWGEVEAALDGA